MTIQTRYGQPPQALDEAIQTYFPAAEWVNAAEISFLESSWNPDATNDTRGLAAGQCNAPYTLEDGTPAQTEHSVGPWQINLCVHTIPETDARDPRLSTIFAHNLWSAAGWQPWFLAARQLGLLPIQQPPGGPVPPPPSTGGPGGVAPGTVITLEITIKSIELRG